VGYVRFCWSTGLHAPQGVGVDVTLFMLLLRLVHVFVTLLVVVGASITAAFVHVAQHVRENIARLCISEGQTLSWALDMPTASACCTGLGWVGLGDRTDAHL
jgi:hypothetical protein